VLLPTGQDEIIGRGSSAMPVSGERPCACFRVRRSKGFGRGASVGHPTDPATGRGRAPPGHLRRWPQSSTCAAVFRRRCYRSRRQPQRRRDAGPEDIGMADFGYFVDDYEQRNDVLW